MHAFRSANASKDAKVRLDIREGGERIIATRRLAARAPVSEKELRDIVKVDLVSLLNTTNLESACDLENAPHVRKSILNYGFPDLSWRTLDEVEISDIAGEVETALSEFEPRLDRKSIKARRDLDAKAEDLRLRFVIKADLRAQPVNLQVEFVAEVEVDSGKIKIDRL